MALADAEKLQEIVNNIGRPDKGLQNPEKNCPEAVSLPDKVDEGADETDAVDRITTAGLVASISVHYERTSITNLLCSAGGR
jgi:hypothetical protein